MTAKTVLVIGTLDTKGEEIAFLRAQIEARGCRTLVADPGVLGEPAFQPDVTRETIARAAGGDLAGVIVGGKEKGIALMALGLERVVRDLYDQGRIDGAIAMAGGRGTYMISPALQSLPLGIPKMLLSTLATGRHRCGWMTGTSDMVLMHSVVDILGINAVSRQIITNAAAAIAGMVQTSAPVRLSHPLPVAATMVGTTTPGVMHAQAMLKTMGYEVITFHPTGSGGRTMEKLIAEGWFRGVLDLSTHDLTSVVCGRVGLGDPGPDRLRNAARGGVPQVIAPGGIDYFPVSPEDRLAEYAARPYIQHSPRICLVKPTAEEMAALGHQIAERLDRPKAPAVVMVPLRGFSEVNREGRPLWNPEGNQALLETLQSQLHPPAELVAMDLHLNDPAFAEAAANRLDSIIAR